jgi:non-heme chloroperoxidase
MRQRRFAAGLWMLFIFGSTQFQGQGAKETIDSFPHTIKFVMVEPGVKLEVLDWGGTGRPVVLLAGLGDDAHVFDALAGKLIGKYHVYGITRGFGASDTPTATEGNYASDRLGDDVIAVLDELKLERPVVAGHSIAGEELSSIGSRHADRVAGLVYLDAGYQYALYVASQRDWTIDGNELKKKVDAIANAMTPQEQRTLVAEMVKTDLPQYEEDLTARLMRLQEIPDRPTPSKAQTKSREFVSAFAVVAGERRYTQIRCPVLAIFADPHYLKPGPPADAKKDADYAARDLEKVEAQSKAFEALGPNVRVVRISNADHYVFRSNEADVLKEMNTFISALP